MVSLALALGLPFHSLALMAQPVSEDSRDRAARLVEKLQGTGPVRMIAFGDSITDGWGVAEPERNTYHQLFAAALRARYHNCRIDVITAGGPGDESAVGLMRVEDEVIARDPDLAIVQFTGNDSRLGRSPIELQGNLELMVRDITNRTEAAIMLVANPMEGPVPGNLYVDAVLGAGKQAGVPVANFDQALFDTHRDFRGPFAYEAHPADFSHAACAKELLAQFDKLTETERLFDVTLEPLCELVPTGGQVRLRAHVGSLVDRPLSVVLDCGAFGLPTRHQLELAPNGKATAELSVPVPPLATASRSVAAELLAIARCGRYSTLDVKWLTFAPVLTPDRPRGSVDETKLHWHRLTHDSLVLGERAWTGDEDLSARIALVAEEGRLVVVIDVTDDDITVASHSQPVSLGDSIEVYLDLRPIQEQGLPVYSRDVVALLGVPATPDGRPARWQPLDSLVPMLADVSFSSRPTGHGYRATFSIPESVLSARTGHDWDGIGFDVGVNDADFGLTRSTQMFYCGHADNYLDPSRLAALVLTPSDRRLWRVTLR